MCCSCCSSDTRYNQRFVTLNNVVSAKYLLFRVFWVIQSINELTDQITLLIPRDNLDFVCWPLLMQIEEWYNWIQPGGHADYITRETPQTMALRCTERISQSSLLQPLATLDKVPRVSEIYSVPGMQHKMTDQSDIGFWAACDWAGDIMIASTYIKAVTRLLDPCCAEWIAVTLLKSDRLQEPWEQIWFSHIKQRAVHQEDRGEY